MSNGQHNRVRWIAALRRLRPAVRAVTQARATIRVKIVLAFLATATLTTAFGAYAVHNIGVTGGLMTATFDQVLISLDYARAAAADFAGLQAAMARQQATGTPAEPSIGALAVQVQDDLRIAAERSLSADARAAAGQATAALAAFMDAIGTQPGLPVAWSVLDRHAAQVNDSVDQLVNLTSGDGFRHRQAAKALIVQSRLVDGVATVVLVLVSALVAVLLSRQIMGPVRAACAAARRIAAGEWAASIPAHLTRGRDELGALLAAMEVMRTNIATMMAQEVSLRRVAQIRLADAIGTSREGVLVVDAAGAVVVANPRLIKLFPALAAPAGACLPDVLALEPLLGCAGDICLPGGTWLRISRSETQDGGAVAIYSDITALKQREWELQSTNECFDAALSNMSQGLCLFDAQDRLRVSNPQFAALYGIDPALLRPGTPYTWIMAAKTALGQMTESDAAAHAALRLGAGPGAFLHHLPDGRAIAISHEPLPGGGWVRTYEDVSERRRAEAQVHHLARHDAVTGLPNRLVLAEHVEQAAARPRAGFALLALGLHDFKIVSDMFGYAVADAVLRRVAERLVAAMGDGDLATRPGTDEFAVLLTNVRTPEEASTRAAQLQNAMAAPFTIEGRDVAIGISLGIALAPADGDTCEPLLRHADLALDRARTEGRNTFRFFETAMDERLQGRRQLEADLQHALARDELELFYQPCVDLAAGRVCGFEALLRWRHPERGMVPPGAFIPVAEASGLIVAIGAWVVHRACQEAVKWPAGLRVAVNVSPLQFASPALLECVASALARSGLAPARLELEVTETVLLRDDGATRATLHQLRALGLRIAMDDFGTGYSSLSYLRSFPFDKIKIDQSFVRSLHDAPGSAAIIRAITGLGTTLGMRTTVEGVETSAELDAVRAAGCDEIQGYFFSRPVPAGQVAELVDDISGRLRVPAQPAVPLPTAPHARAARPTPAAASAIPAI